MSLNPRTGDKSLVDDGFLTGDLMVTGRIASPGGYECEVYGKERIQGLFTAVSTM